MKPRPRTLLPVAVGLVLLVGACAPASAPSEARPSPTTSVEPTPSPDPSFEALVAEGIRLRTFLGLRADEEWVRAVSADPGAKTEFGIPLTIAEEAELGARASSRQEIQPLLEKYAAEHPDEYAGLMIDQDAGGILVILFTDHIEEHGAAIAQLVRPGSKVEVRRAGMSERDLEALMNRINSESDLLQNAGVFVLVISTDELSGKLVVEVSTQRGDAQPLLAARYGPNVEVVVTDPTGGYLKPMGTIKGRVVDADGDGIRGTVASEPLFAADLPRDSVGPPETEADGTFQLNGMLPGRWRLTAEGEGLGPTSVEVDVPAGGTATVEIVLD
jgi:hypothetical protein